MSSTVLKRLTELLVDANRQYDALQTCYERLQNKYNTLYSEHMTLHHRYRCEACLTRIRQEPDGGCVELCPACSDRLHVCPACPDYLRHRQHQPHV